MSWNILDLHFLGGELVVKLKHKNFKWTAAKNRFVKQIKIGNKYDVENIQFIEGVQFYKLKGIEGAVFCTTAFEIIKDTRIFKPMAIGFSVTEINLEVPESKKDE